MPYHHTIRKHSFTYRKINSQKVMEGKNISLHSPPLSAASYAGEFLLLLITKHFSPQLSATHIFFLCLCFISAMKQEMHDFLIYQSSSNRRVNVNFANFATG